MSSQPGPAQPRPGLPGPFRLGSPDRIPQRDELFKQLSELVEFEATMGPEGFQGLIVECDVCQAEHHCSWAVLQANIHQLLFTGIVADHEPAFQPDLLAFVTWEYARGFLAAVVADQS